MTNAATHWNHRFVKSVGPDGQDIYGIHEVHYDASNNAVSWNPEPIPVMSDDPDRLSQIIDQCVKTMKQPMLTVAEDGSLVDNLDDLADFVANCPLGDDQ